MSQYLVCMHDESLIEYTEERREARVKLLLPRRGSTRASEIDRNRDRKRVARSLVTELSSRGVQAKSVADLSLGSVASVANRCTVVQDRNLVGGSGGRGFDPQPSR